jgi:hypothetical protein
VSAGDDFLSRWSRRKHASRRGEGEEAAPKAPAPAAASPAPANAEPAQEAQPLPPVESLTPESDFTPFMRGDVDPVLRRQALRTLFRDPRFNVMDGLDVYIDDFSKPDPIPPEWLGQLRQMARLGDYAQTEAAAKEAEEARSKEAKDAKEATDHAATEAIGDDNQAVAVEAPKDSAIDPAKGEAPPDSIPT